MSCGTDQPNQKFWAVCGLAPRARPYDANWEPEGSGTLVQWVDSQNLPQLGIVTIRHLISQGGGSAGQCVQPDNWYAYFKKCVPAPPWPPPTYWCPEDPNPCEIADDVVRVRVTCFTMASGSFFDDDCVLVGHLDPADVECLSHITPMVVASPYELEMCRDDPVFMTGWGRTLDADCKEVAPTQNLHVAPTTLNSINCKKNGRGGLITLAPGSCVQGGACQPELNLHDSGVAIAVEMSDGTLRLVGVNKGGGELIASTHQFFSDPNATDYLCMPCRPLPCVDVAGPPTSPHGPYTGPDGFLGAPDYQVYAGIPMHAVNCGCVTDIDQDGCAGDADDLQWLLNASSINPPRECDRFQWCYGDANLDGRVNSLDAALITERLGECMCSTCTPILQWCPGDLNCDGMVDSLDSAIVSAVRALEADGDVACQDVNIGCSSQGNCPP